MGWITIAGYEKNDDVDGYQDDNPNDKQHLFRKHAA
jgi:hypothetical protein